jgi:alginate O-acetyltransferase complex protein AlgJ
MEVIAPSSTTASDRGVAVSRARSRRATDALLVALFLAGICAPLLGVQLGRHGWDIGSLADRRKTAEPLLLQAGVPQLASTRGKLKALARFPGQFKYYLSDHFGFRNLLIELHGRLMVDGLGVTSNPSVILGKDGWLFLANEGSLDDYRHDDPFTPAELEAWRTVLERRQQWCAARKIQYLVVFAPSKHSIYPEYMPNVYTRLAQPARLPQLVEYLQTHHSLVRILDLTQPLLDAKAGGIRLYQKTDTHWNDRGAWAGYRAVMAAASGLVPGVHTLAASDFQPDTIIAPGMDLAGLLGLNGILQEKRLDLQPRIALRLAQVEQDVVEPFTVNASAPGQPGVVVFRDSFFTQVLPWLAEGFGRGAYFWQYGFNRQIIEAERPALVIQEIAERKLSMSPTLLDRDLLDVRLVDGKWKLSSGR